MAFYVAHRGAALWHLVIDGRERRKPHFESRLAHAVHRTVFFTTEYAFSFATDIRVPTPLLAQRIAAKGEIGAHGHLFGRGGPHVCAESLRAMKRANPIRTPFRKYGNDFAGDRADLLIVIVDEGLHQLAEPVGFHQDIVVAINDDLASSFGEGAITGKVGALLRFM